MTYETLEIERAGAVATVWMNRPQVHNAFNETLIAELSAAWAALDADDHVQAGQLLRHLERPEGVHDELVDERVDHGSERRAAAGPPTVTCIAQVGGAPHPTVEVDHEHASDRFDRAVTVSTDQHVEARLATAGGRRDAGDLWRGEVEVASGQIGRAHV